MIHALENWNVRWRITIHILVIVIIIIIIISNMLDVITIASLLSDGRLLLLPRLRLRKLTATRMTILIRTSLLVTGWTKNSGKWRQRFNVVLIIVGIIVYGPSKFITIT